LLTKLFECKYDTQRAGWLKQLGIAGRVESVADHSWSAMVLAEAILPEACPEELEAPEYSKAEVIRMLLIHDLAEAYTGDRPSDMPGQDPDGPHRTQELHLIETIEFFNLLKGIDGFGKLVSRWQTIEKREGINGKIANFFDKTDAFFQLVIYSKYYFEQRIRPDLSSRWDRFFGLLRDAVLSSANGNPYLERLADEVTDWGGKVFESSEPFLPHDEMYSGANKYYPVRMRQGSTVEISAKDHNQISRSKENSHE
jgi:5'-deoxynucleotidase YfbR-like HD superfamily hydrolase